MVVSISNCGNFNGADAHYYESMSDSDFAKIFENLFGVGFRTKKYGAEKVWIFMQVLQSPLKSCFGVKKKIRVDSKTISVTIRGVDDGSRFL